MAEIILISLMLFVLFLLLAGDIVLTILIFNLSISNKIIKYLILFFAGAMLPIIIRMIYIIFLIL
jgi:hypothetical protein